MDKRTVDSWKQYKRTVAEHNMRVHHFYNSKRAESRRNHAKASWWRRMFSINLEWELAGHDLHEQEEKLTPTFEGYLNWELERENHGKAKDDN